MEVTYRRMFLRDLKKLRRQPIYDHVYEISFAVLPVARTLRAVRGVKAMRGHANRYRIRIGDYRIGIEVRGNTVEMLRVLHRSDFYRYFH